MPCTAGELRRSGPVSRDARTRCPTCLVWLMRWGGYWRWVRAPLLIERIWIRRGRCRVCHRTHALLPDLALARRLDEVTVIGRWVASKVIADVGLRGIAEHLDVPHTTVRTWWRRFRARSPTMLAHCSALAAALDGTAVMLATTGDRAAVERSRWPGSVRRYGSLPPSVSSGDSGVVSAAARRLAPTRPRPGQADPEWIGWRHPLSEVTSLSVQSAEVIALFRYRIISEATSARLGPAERGRIVRELARRAYDHPDGSQRQYARGTFDRWFGPIASRV
ncbi:MAG: hypothetical protein JOZ65_21050 [Chloroflexi bacterium]|nr:hypothetical protein [Chloroflexota bacterium]